MLKYNTLPNGLTLIVEEIPYVSSVAYDLFIPGGIISDKEDTIGASLILAEMTSRGAGDYDSRSLIERFDDMGVVHSEAAGKSGFAYKGALLPEKLADALDLVAMMVLKPHLPAEEIDNVRNLFLQDIRSLQDDPARRAMMSLNEKYYPVPYGRPAIGTLEGLQATTTDTLRSEWERLYHPAGAVLSIAGKVTYAEVEKIVLHSFDKWQGEAVKKPAFNEVTKGGYHHIESDSAQLQITLAYPSVPFLAPHYYAAKVALNILSGGMFGRLFVEVREKLGLCYSVYAGHICDKEYGNIIAYAGTVPERAEKTLEVMLRELKNLKGTITQEELDRAKANYLSNCIIADESISARASSNASEWWMMHKIRSLDEIENEVNKVTMADVDSFCEAYPVSDYLILTLGSRCLQHIAK